MARTGEVAFGRFRLHLGARTLFRDGQPVSLKGRPLEILCVLAEAGGALVTKDELMARVWRGVIVEENAIQVHISALRKALEDETAAQSPVLTVQGRGYRLIGVDRDTRMEPGTTDPAVPSKPSIAVMPFANMSEDPGQDYFADGITEDIITALSKVRWFFVVARNSSFPYKGRVVDVKQVGRELGVRYVLEGSVRRAGPQVRITAQLVDTVSGNHVWAERYDRQLADLFAVQDQITERVVAAIEPQLFAAEYIRGQRKPPESLDAWECVVRAMSCVAQGTGAGDAEAEALCRRAIAISPDYGQAHSLLAVVLLRRVSFSGDLKSALPEATASARAALRLDEGDSWAHLAQGMVFFRMRRHGDAVRAYRQALELNPNSALAHAALGHALAAQGAHEEAIKSAEHALGLSPSDARVGAQASHVLVFARFVAGDYAESATLAQAMLARYPEYLPAHYVLVAANAMNGDLKAASEALATLLRVRPQFSLAGVCEIMPWTGEISARLVQGWHLAGVPPGG